MGLASFVAFTSFIAAPAHAAFEDFTSNAAAAAMGEAWTAVTGDIGALGFNPAAIAPMSTPQFSAGYRRSWQIPAGQVDLNQMSGAAGLPIDLPELRGVAAIAWSDTSRPSLALDHSVGFTYATQGWREFDSGLLDVGITLNGLTRSGRATGGSATKAGVDLGTLFRMRNDRVIGVSVLNVNGPRINIPGVQDRAPVVFKAGYSEVYRNFTMALDISKREPSLGFPASQSLGAGIQYWWNMARGGSLAGRTGINMADRSKAYSVGTGWRVLGGEADYALVVPLSTGRRLSHVVSLVFHFGTWNPEREYEKLLDTELRYRQDLARALDASDARQKKLAQEIAALRSEVASLRGALAAKTEEESMVKEKLRIIEEREKRAREALEDIGRQKHSIEQKSKESLYREDWVKYQQLKADGAADLVLSERIQQILRQYKDTGVDLSDANQELMRLLRNRPAP